MTPLALGTFSALLALS